MEYAVKMKQLPDEASLANRIVSGKATPDEMMGLGERLAEFYVATEHGGQIDRYGGNQVIEFNTEENFRQLAPFVGNLVGRSASILSSSPAADFSGIVGTSSGAGLQKAESATVMETLEPSMSISSMRFR